MWPFDEMKHKIIYQEPSAEGGGSQVLSSFLQTEARVAIMLLGLYSAWSDLSVGMSRSNCTLLWEGPHWGSNVLALCVQDCSISQPMEYIPHGRTDLVKLKMMQAQWFPWIHVLFFRYLPSHLYTQLFLYDMTLPLWTTGIEGKKTKRPPTAASYFSQPV